MKSLSSSNPIIPHPMQSLDRMEMRMQYAINRIAKKIIRDDHAQSKGFIIDRYNHMHRMK